MSITIGNQEITKITITGPDFETGLIGNVPVYGEGEGGTSPLPLSKFSNYWPMETDFLDSVGDAHGVPNDINLSGGDKFNGATTCNVELPDNILTSDDFVGVGFLVKTNDQTIEQRVLALNSNGTGRPFVQVKILGDTVTAKAHSSSGISSSGNDTSQLIHIYYQANRAGNTELFINGEFKGELSMVNFAETTPKGNFVGSSRTGFSRNLNGDMFGLVIATENLTHAEVLATATEELAGNRLF